MIVLAYVVVGVWLLFVCQAIGEIATLLPLPGAFNAWGGRVFDEAFSFQMTWMYFINWALTIPAQLSASAVIVSFWLPPDSKFPPWIVPMLIIIIMVFINSLGVKTYGELEYWFSIPKIFTIIIFIICGILVDAGALGGVTYGAKNWQVDGAPFKGGFLAFMNTLVSVAFAYSGTEMTGVTAAESRNPHKHVPKAVNTVFFRIAFFYIVSIFLIGSLIDNSDPLINNTANTATDAPFTLVFVKAGMKGAVHYMNAIIFTSLFSAINADFYVATRMLLSLARNEWAHKSIGYTNARGVPLVALGVITLCSLLSLLTIFIGSGTVFHWLVSICGSIIFQSWIFTLLLHFRFRYCWNSQGRPVSDLPYVSWGYPYGNILATIIGFGCIIATCYLSVTGFPHYPGADAGTEALNTYKAHRDLWYQNLLGSWFPWVCSTFLYAGYKIVHMTPFIRAEDADLDTGRFIPTEADKQDLIAHGPLWKRIVSYLI
jgi:lysine-specific permease